jgi:hypothetical protein
MLNNKIKPEKISNGNKVNYLHIKNLNITFIDSVNFTMCPLKAFPKTFDLEGKKVIFHIILILKLIKII